MTTALNTPSHAEAMDGVYRSQRHIYDFTRRYYLIGRDRLITGLGVPKHSTILEIGCGTGRNLLKVAHTYPETQCFGVDISEQMLFSMANAIARAQLSGQVHFAQGDAESFDAKSCFSVSGFDRVYLSYCLSMIPDWRRALDQALRQVGKDGELHIVDFGQMARWPAFARDGLGAWLAKFRVSPRANLVAVAKDLALKHGFSVSFDEIGGGYAWLIVLRRLEER